MNPKKPANTSTAERALLVLLFSILFVSPAHSQQPPSPSKQQAAPPPAAEPDSPPDARLLTIKRICVQSFGADALGVQAQEMVIAKLFESKRFALTENCDRADFVLKGSVTERNERAARSESEGIGFTARGSASARDTDGASGSASSTLSANTYEALSSSGYKQSAAVTLRIVDKDGEILWAVSMESEQGKTRSAIGEAADRAVRRFLRDIQRAASPPASSPAKPAVSSPSSASKSVSNRKRPPKKTSSRTARSPQSPPVKSQPPTSPSR